MGAGVTDFACPCLGHIPACPVIDLDKGTGMEGKMSEKFEAKNIREVCALLATDPDRGLSEKEAAKRHETGGPNELKETKKKSALESFLEQLNDPLIYVLMAAAVISLLLHEISDAADRKSVV